MDIDGSWICLLVGLGKTGVTSSEFWYLLLWFLWYRFRYYNSSRTGFFTTQNNPTSPNLQLQLNLYPPRPTSGRCFFHPIRPHPNLWHLSPLCQYLFRSFPPVPLHSDLILIHATHTALSWSVPLLDTCRCSLNLCPAPSRSAMYGTDPFHPYWSAPIRVAPYKSVLLCAALRHQNLPQ